MLRLLVVANAAVSLASIAPALIALFQPSTLSGTRHADRGERYFARLYASRSIPLGLLFAAAPIAWRGELVQLLLLLAAAIQGADAGIGIWARNKKMMIGAGAATMIHLFCAHAVS